MSEPTSELAMRTGSLLGYLIAKGVPAQPVVVEGQFTDRIRIVDDIGALGMIDLTIQVISPQRPE